MTDRAVILAAVEDSDHGEAAARTAASYARRLDAELHAIHVVNIPKAVYTMFTEVPLQSEEVAAAAAAAVWARMLPVFEEAGVEVTPVDLEGIESDQIVSYAESIGADLIVVGNRRLGELRRLFLGSTSSRVIQLAPCDVLIASVG